jgi:hypothetical protein
MCYDVDVDDVDDVDSDDNDEQLWWNDNEILREKLVSVPTFL